MRTTFSSIFACYRKYCSKSVRWENSSDPPARISLMPEIGVGRECRNVIHSGHVYGITAIKMYETRNVGCCSNRAPENRQRDILDNHVSTASNYQWFQKGRKITHARESMKPLAATTQRKSIEKPGSWQINSTCISSPGNTFISFFRHLYVTILI